MNYSNLKKAVKDAAYSTRQAFRSESEKVKKLRARKAAKKTLREIIENG
jgi:hypothetical protein